MADIRNLLNRLGAEEEALRSRLFLAPCVRGGQLRANVSGLFYTFTPRPRQFEGWGIFRPLSEHVAQLVEEAGLARITEYFRLLPILRLRLAYRLRGSTWLAFPVNGQNLRRHFPLREPGPLPVHLVTDGEEFEQVVARSHAGVCWFEELDRRAAPAEAESLREALRNRTRPVELGLKGATPEMRACYSIVFRRAESVRESNQRRDALRRASLDEMRLRDALRFGGGDLCGFRDRGEFWLVEWTARDGQLHASAIAKNDLTVISAGICLSGEDQKFDLQSLVGVVDDEG